MPSKPKVSLTDDGLVHYDFGSGHAVITGQAEGVVTLPDGTKVDVGPAIVGVDSQEQALALSDAIGRLHEIKGHPAHDVDQPFVHTPSSVSHGGKFAEAVEALAPAGNDSSPQAVIDAVTKKKG